VTASPKTSSDGITLHLHMRKGMITSRDCPDLPIMTHLFAVALTLVRASDHLNWVLPCFAFLSGYPPLGRDRFWVSPDPRLAATTSMTPFRLRKFLMLLDGYFYPSYVFPQLRWIVAGPNGPAVMFGCSNAPRLDKALDRSSRRRVLFADYSSTTTASSTPGAKRVLSRVAGIEAPQGVSFVACSTESHGAFIPRL